MKLQDQSGFTLIEICVALAVLSAGVLVFGCFLDGFNRLRTLEREQANALILSADVVEEFVQNPPLCADTSIVYENARVEIQRVPGAKPLAWARVSAHAIQEVQLRRLIRCQRKKALR